MALALVRKEAVRKLVRTESAVSAALARFEIRPRLKGSDLKSSPFPRAHTRELGAGAQRLDALKPGVTKTLVTSLVTKERAGFQSAVSNQVSMETDVLPTVSSGPVSKAVSTQSGFKLALAKLLAGVVLAFGAGR